MDRAQRTPPTCHPPTVTASRESQIQLGDDRKVAVTESWTIIPQHPAEHSFGNRGFPEAVGLKRPKNCPGRTKLCPSPPSNQDFLPVTPKSWVDQLRCLGRDRNDSLCLNSAGALPDIDQESLKAGQGGLWEEFWVSGIHRTMVAQRPAGGIYSVCGKEKRHKSQRIKN